MDLWLNRVRNDYRELANVPLQTSRRIKAALRQDWRALGLIKQQTIKWCLRALGESPEAANLIHDRNMLRKCLETGRFGQAVNHIDDPETRRWLARSSTTILRGSPQLIDDFDLEPDRLVVIRSAGPVLFRLLPDPTLDEWRDAIRHNCVPPDRSLPPELVEFALRCDFARYIRCVREEDQTVELLQGLPLAAEQIALVSNNKTRAQLQNRPLIAVNYIYLDPMERMRFF